MRIAFILPSLARRGPILVVKDIVSQINNKADIDVYYFDDITEIKFDCPTYKINISDQIDFDRYDIIHSHGYRPDKYLWKNRKKINGKTVSTLHADIRLDLRYNYNIAVSWIYRWIWLFFIRSHDKVVVLTKCIMNDYYSHYISREKLTYIYNGISLNEIKKSLFIDIDENDKKLLNVIKENKFKIIGANAILTERKGLHYIISVLPIIPDYVFFIVGDGKEKEKLLKLAVRLGVANRCYFLGFKNNAISYLQYYDIYVMPSISEGFGLALLEAAFTRKSCLCSNIDVFREIFTEDEVTFCDPKDKQSLKIAIEEAYKMRSEKGEKVYQRVTNNYTMEIMGNSYFSLYNHLSNKKLEIIIDG
jgi:glycosyltransferase involved in cell wall biosynthesis